MSKRHAEDAASSSGPPPIKKIHFEPHLIGPVSTLEEMDIKVLQFQNKKLAQVNEGKNNVSTIYYASLKSFGQVVHNVFTKK